MGRIVSGPIQFFATGVPAPQGSHQAHAIKKKNPVTGKAEYTGRVAVHQDNKNTDPWRNKVQAAAVVARYQGQRFNARTGAIVFPAGPVEVVIEFFMPRPKNHYGTGRNAGKLKPSAPEWCTTKPDTDKLERAVLDALTKAGVYGDDGQVAKLGSTKRYAPERGGTGALITVRTLEPK